MTDRPVRVAVDAMGGDNAPEEVVRGALAAAAADRSLEVILVGDAKRIEPLTAEVPSRSGAYRIIHAPHTVSMDEHPVEAIRRREDTSIRRAAELVRNGEADGFVSAGSTGAAMAAALLRIGRLPGVDRPAVCSLMPTVSGVCLIVDAGANVDCRPVHLVQFAEMGALYAQHALGIASPRVALLNVGEEETKGNELAVKAHELLKARSHLNFIGNVEGRDISWGRADVVVCDGFVGNIVLKFAEGMGTALFSLIREGLNSGWRARLGGLLARPALVAIRKRVDYTEYGGAPLLGVRGVCIISHGSSNAKAIANAVRVAVQSIRQNMVAAIASRLKEYERAVN